MEDDWQDDDLMSKVLEMQESICYLEAQNAELKRQLAFKDQLLCEASSTLLKQPVNGMTRKITQRFIDYKARFEYYNEQKIHHKGEWRSIKSKTDALYEMLTQEQKQVYRNNVVNKLGLS